MRHACNAFSPKPGGKSHAGGIASQMTTLQSWPLQRPSYQVPSRGIPNLQWQRCSCGVAVCGREKGGGRCPLSRRTTRCISVGSHLSKHHRAIVPMVGARFVGRRQWAMQTRACKIPSGPRGGLDATRAWWPDGAHCLVMYLCSCQCARQSRLRVFLLKLYEGVFLLLQ